MKTCVQKKISSFILCIALIVAIALLTTGCNGSSNEGRAPASEQVADTQADHADKAQTSGTDSDTQSDNSISDDSQTSGNDSDTQFENSTDDSQTSGTDSDTQADSRVLGEGSTQFTFTVADSDGNETSFEIHTDKETVGEALLELELIEGEDGEYGLYVKTVNGITADADKNGTYWAFYINDEYAQTGVDSTPITEGDSYLFKVEKA